MYTNNTSENESDNESENKYDENESDNVSKNKCDESFSDSVFVLTPRTLTMIEKIREYSISHGYADDYTAEDYAQVMAFKPYIPYIIEDDNHNKYVGVHLYDINKSLEENLNVCMRQHFNDNKKSPVLRMVNPVIRPFNGDIKDEEPQLFYYHAEQILELEKKHIGMVLHNCNIDGTKILNNVGNIRPVIIEKPKTQINVIDEEIKRWDKKLIIETESHPTKNNPNRITYVIKSQPLCDHLDIKSRRVRSVDKNKLLQLKYESIADMCMVPLEKVNEVLKLDIKPSPEYRKRIKQQKNCFSNYYKKKEEEKEKKKEKEKTSITVEINDEEKHLLTIRTMFK